MKRLLMARVLLIVIVKEKEHVKMENAKVMNSQIVQLKIMSMMNYKILWDLINVPRLVIVREKEFVLLKDNVKIQIITLILVYLNVIHN
jgi:hypothetical protein